MRYRERIARFQMAWILSALFLLAPAHMGLTVSAQPVLYWYNSQDIPTAVRVEVVNELTLEPLLEMTLDPPVRAGIHAISLAKAGSSLEVGVDYTWVVAALGQPAAGLAATAQIRRISPPAPVTEVLPGASAQAAAAIYGDAGLWYDALHAVSRHPAQQADLLGQVGLEQVAKSVQP